MTAVTKTGYNGTGKARMMLTVLRVRKVLNLERWVSGKRLFHTVARETQEKYEFPFLDKNKFRIYETCFCAKALK